MPEALCVTSQVSNSPEWLNDGGFIPVILGVIVMFWGITFLCEEYSVPALALFCKRNKIPDHITGSIFIGTGLSLPVFFVALIGLFVSNSAIGVGAVVGGNLFNHLITIPTSIYVTPNKVLKLDPFVFTRELLCYLISCLVLIWSIQNRNIGRGLKNTLSEHQWESCLLIPWVNSLVLLICFVLYCLLNAFFDDIVDSFYYVYNLAADCCSSLLPQYFPLRDSSVVEETLEIKRKSFVSILFDEVGVGISDEVSSLSMEVIDRSLQLSTTVTDQPSNEALELAAAVGANDNDEMKRESLHSNRHSNFDVVSMKVVGSTLDHGEDHHLHGHHLNVLAMPEKWIEIPFWLLCFPMRVMIYMTVPDVRRPVHRHRAILSMFMSLLWLFAQSFVLTESLTLLGNLWGINSAVMGLTVAAWASNYPAHWSSVVVAKESTSSSADDIASCNVFGSNIFNNFIGLGLPWILYSLIYQQPYNDLQDQGVVLSIVILMLVIVIHYVATAACGFTNSAWMIPFMVVGYLAGIGYLCYFISQF